MISRALCGVLTLVCFGVRAEPQAVVLKATADVGLSSAAGQGLMGNGAGITTPIRQNQSWSGFETRALLLNFDTAPIRGWTVSNASLHLVIAKGELYGAGLCEVLAPWSEPASVNFQSEVGGPCWDFARAPADPDRPQPADYWAWPQKGIFGVAWAHPAARYIHAGPGKLRRESVRRAGAAGSAYTRLVIPVDPAMVEALAAGVSHGLILTDDKGQVAEALSLVGTGYPYRANEAEDIWVFTRDAQDPDLRPRLEVFGEAADRAAPAAPRDLKVAAVDSVDGSFTLQFTAPGDDGDEGCALAYAVRCAPAGAGAATLLPRWELPRPLPAGGVQRLPIWSLAPGRYVLEVEAVDEAGNRGPAASVEVLLPPKPDVRFAAGEARFAAATPAPTMRQPGGVTVFAVPDMVKVDPVTGAVLCDGNAYRADPDFLVRNAIFDGARQAIFVNTPANGTAAFQLIVRRAPDRALANVKVVVSDLAGPSGASIPATGNAELFRLWYFKSEAHPEQDDGVQDTASRPSAWHADACLPLAPPFDETFAVPATDNAVPGQTCQAVWVDILAPAGTPPGAYTGLVTVAAGDVAAVVLPLTVNVLQVSLPAQPGYTVELNCYGKMARFAGVDPQGPEANATEWTFHQLARRHRLSLNVLSIHQNGRVDGGYVPALGGEGAAVGAADWTAFDATLGPLLDGSAFTPAHGYTGPGQGLPLTHLYLPFHENWPLPLAAHYADYARLSNRLEFAEWAKTSRPLPETFGPDYQAAYARVARQFAEHAAAKGWTNTTFHAYVNNKYYYKFPFIKERGFSGVSFWLLDEPIDYDDYAAIEFFLGLCRQGVRAANTKVQFACRVDVSQPELARGLWDGVVDLWVCNQGVALRKYAATAAMRARWLPEQVYWHYGGGPSLSAPPINFTRMFLASWCAGAAGSMPYFTTLTGAWDKTDESTAVYYPGKNYALGARSFAGPLPGVRAKLLRRGQQDIELLQQLSAAKGWNRGRVRQALAAYADDPAAPVLTFDRLTLERLEQLRAELVATIRQTGEWIGTDN
jgi:hypothetical protein